MLKYIISIGLCLVFTLSFSQKPPPPNSGNKPPKEKKEKPKSPKDTIVYKTGYGFRFGIDISKPALAILDKSYSGLEIVADYRIKKNLYIATELGYEEEITFEDYTTSSVSGSYIKLGANINVYKNWLDMNNEIFIGGRYGFALFDSTLNEYIPNVVNSDYPTYFPNTTKTVDITETNLTAHWLELQLGIKVETFKNFFVSFSGGYKIGISITDPENFKTLYAPGFNRVYSTSTGFGFNYTLSYLIPFVKK